MELFPYLAETKLTVEGDIEKAMSDAKIMCIASGAVGGQMKFYFYAQARAIFLEPFCTFFVNISYRILMRAFI